MDLIAQRGIASHYSGRGFVTGFVGRTIPYGRSSRGKTVCLNNANIALRVLYLYSLLFFDSLLVVLGGSSWQTPFMSHDFDSNFMDQVSCFLQIGWLNAIREWQEEFVGNMSSREFVETITRDLLGSRVFVFTPRGEVRNWIAS